MEYQYTPPPLPSLARLRSLYRDAPGDSVLRKLEFEALATKRLAGRILDIGGGRKAHYLRRLPAGLDLESVNIDPKIEPTYLIRPGDPLPVQDQSFDGAVSFNTLEHVYDARLLLDEIHRVLKPGATAHISVPFIFRIHAHPDDYFRGTPSWWAETLRRVGFARTEITPLIWGRYTTARMICGHHGLLPAGWEVFIALMKDLAYAATSFHGKRTYDGSRGERICAVSPAWFISATKRAQ
ncbi:MAG: class I SAM-dependent methyltransferase [Alphaproteobacteria bacterium]|nr:class I SAM-dependent methyltransferase [Alphaproteobacteria bacterium]